MSQQQYNSHHSLNHVQQEGPVPYGSNGGSIGDLHFTYLSPAENTRQSDRELRIQGTHGFLPDGANFPDGGPLGAQQCDVHGPQPEIMSGQRINSHSPSDDVQEADSDRERSNNERFGRLLNLNVSVVVHFASFGRQCPIGIFWIFAESFAVRGCMVALRFVRENHFPNSDWDTEIVPGAIITRTDIATWIVSIVVASARLSLSGAPAGDYVITVRNITVASFVVIILMEDPVARNMRRSRTRASLQ